MNLCMRRLPSESYNNSEELGLHRWRRRRISRDQRDSEKQARSPTLHFLLMTTALTGVHLQMLVEIQYASAVLIRKLNLQGPRNVSNKLSQIIVSMELKILEFETAVIRWQPMGADWCPVVLWARRAEMIETLWDLSLWQGWGSSLAVLPSAGPPDTSELRSWGSTQRSSPTLKLQDGNSEVSPNHVSHNFGQSMTAGNSLRHLRYLLSVRYSCYQ